MKSVFRLLLVALLVFVLAQEPQKQVQAEPKPEVAVQIITQAPVVEAPVEPIKPPVVTVYHSDDFYKEYIFSHESSNRLNAVNSIGCYGLGQDCNNALANECPNWQTDLDCQLRFWDKYAIRRYKSWANAYQFWINHKWW